MKIAISTMLFGHPSLEDVIKEVAVLGYGYIEIAQSYFPAFSANDEESRRLKGWLQASGVELAALFEVHNLAALDEGTRVEEVARMKQAIRRCHSLGYGLISSEMGGTPASRLSCTEAFEQSLGELVPVLEETGVKICFEAHPGDFLEESDPAVDLIKRIGSENVGYLFCIPHAFILGEDPVHMLEYARDVLSFVHVGDALRPERVFYSGELPGRPGYQPAVKPHQHLIPGLGDVDFGAVFATLKKIGYEGFVATQSFSHFDEPALAATRTKEKIEEFLRQS
jgi:myo-inositol catabolism protein IolH